MPHRTPPSPPQTVHVMTNHFNNGTPHVVPRRHVRARYQCARVCATMCPFQEYSSPLLGSRAAAETSRRNLKDPLRAAAWFSRHRRPVLTAAAVLVGVSVATSLYGVVTDKWLQVGFLPLGVETVGRFSGRIWPSALV